MKHLRPVPLPPARLLSAEQAAAYCGLSRNTFLVRVEAGTFPAAMRIGKRVLWDRHAIDTSIDVMQNPLRVAGGGWDDVT